MPSRFSDIHVPEFHSQVMTILMGYLSCADFFADERRHVSSLISNAACVYTEWPELTPSLIALSTCDVTDIAATAIDCLGLCAVNHSPVLDDDVYVTVLASLWLVRHEHTIAPTLRLLYAAFGNSERRSCYRDFANAANASYADFCSSPVFQTLLYDLSDFLERCPAYTEFLGAPFVRFTLQCAGNVDGRVDDNARVRAFYLLELLIAHSPEFFMEDGLSLAVADLCAAFLPHFEIVRDVLRKASDVFGGTSDFCMRCADLLISSGGSDASLFDFFGVCFPSVVNHLAAFFSDIVLAPLLSGASHASADVRASAFAALEQILASLPHRQCHNAPLEELLSLILDALLREAAPDAVSAELWALASFCRSSFDASAHDASAILSACEALFPAGDRRAILSCYQSLAESGVRLSDAAVGAVLDVVRGGPDDSLFVGALSCAAALLRGAAPAVGASLAAFLIDAASACDTNADALSAREVLDLLRALAAVHETAADASGALARVMALALTRLSAAAAAPWEGDDLSERRRLLDGLVLAARACDAAAAAHRPALAGLACALLAESAPAALAPAALKLARAAAAPDVADALAAALARAAERPALAARALDALAVAVAEMPAPDAHAVLAFARGRIAGAAAARAAEAARGHALEDVRENGIAFEPRSVELAIVRVARALARATGYAEALADFIRACFADGDPFVVRIAFVLAADYARADGAEQAVVAAAVALVEGMIEREDDCLYFAFTVVAALLAEHVLDGRKAHELMRRAMESATDPERPVTGQLVALFCGAVAYGDEFDCGAVFEVVAASVEKMGRVYMEILFPDQVVRVIVTLLARVDRFAVLIGWPIAGRIVEDGWMTREGEEAVEQAMRAFRDTVEREWMERSGGDAS
jgi:hypothetical protein